MELTIQDREIIISIVQTSIGQLTKLFKSFDSSLSKETIRASEDACKLICINFFERGKKELVPKQKTEIRHIVSQQYLSQFGHILKPPKS